jgi:hypothetical protein
VQFLRVDGPDLSGPVVDEKRFDTALPIQLAAIDDYLRISVWTGLEANPSYIGVIVRSAS